MTKITYIKQDTSDWNVDEWKEKLSSILIESMEQKLETFVQEIAADVIQVYFDEGDPLCAALFKEGVLLEDASGNRVAFLKWKEEGAWIDFSDEKFLRYIIQRMMEDCITHHEEELESFKRIVNDEILLKEGSKPAKLKPKDL